MERKYKIVDGHIIVKNPFSQEMPIAKIILKSNKTTYRFDGRYDGQHSVSAKALRLMEKDSEGDDEKTDQS